MTLKFLRQPTKSESRHIATHIWGICIDFQSIREFGDTEQFYKDVLGVINCTQTIDAFTSDYVGDCYEDLHFDVVYDTIRYLTKKKIIPKL